MHVLRNDTHCSMCVHIWACTQSGNACVHVPAHTSTYQNTYICVHTCSNLAYAHTSATKCTDESLHTCACLHMQVSEACTEPTESTSEGNKATQHCEQGLPCPSPPESHFLESVSGGGVSESELGAGPSGGTGRRGGHVGKGEAPNFSFKVSPRRRRNLLQFAQPKHWAIVVSSGGEELGLASPVPGLVSPSDSGMESVVQPSVFVVDGQTDIPFRRLGQNRRRRRCGIAQVSLVLILLLGAGLGTQGWFILRLHQRLGDMVARLPVRRVWGTEGVSPVSACLFVAVCVPGREPSRIAGLLLSACPSEPVSSPVMGSGEGSKERVVPEALPG